MRNKTSTIGEILLKDPKKFKKELNTIQEVICSMAKTKNLLNELRIYKNKTHSNLKILEKQLANAGLAIESKDSKYIFMEIIEPCVHEFSNNLHKH